jgi:hypothetical protein
MQITSKTYLIKITFVFFSEDYKLETITLFDTSADLNCIKEGVLPKQFLQNISTKLSAANNGFYLKNFFVITNDINHTIILRTPFIDIICKTPS